jgi:hypothetical protein
MPSRSQECAEQQHLLEVTRRCVAIGKRRVELGTSTSQELATAVRTLTVAIAASGYPDMPRLQRDLERILATDLGALDPEQFERLIQKAGA